MPKKTITVLAILVPLFLFTFADFLPQPLRGMSVKARNSANEFVLGFFPSWRPKTQPYERTRKAVEQESESTPTPNP